MIPYTERPQVGNMTRDWGVQGINRSSMKLNKTLGEVQNRQRLGYDYILFVVSNHCNYRLNEL
jgi:hypothetical protein